MLRIIFKDERGTSVLEVMIATVVFMVIMLGGLQYYYMPQATFARKKINRLAIAQAQKRMETIIALGYSSVSPDSNETDTDVTIGARSGLRSTTVVEVDDPLDGIGAGDISGDSVDYKIINVTLAWNDGVEHDVTFSTVLSDFSRGSSGSGDSESGGDSGSGDSGGGDPPLFADWGRKCELVIQADKVDETLTDFPVLLTEDSLPSEMLDANGSYPALDGGGDIRFTSDSSGTSQISCEIVDFSTHNNPSNATAEIWVKVPTVLDTANTSIWVWYNKSGESQPATGDEFGSHSVWDANYAAVWHLNERSWSWWPQFKDATSNANDGSGWNMWSERQTTGKIGYAIDFDGNNDYIYAGTDNSLDMGASDLTFSGWFKTSSSSSQTLGAKGSNVASSAKRYHFSWTAGVIQFEIDDATTSQNVAAQSTHNDGQWHYAVGVRDDTYLRFYVDGVEANTAINIGAYGNIDSPRDMYIGAIYDESGSSVHDYFNGDVDEMRVTSSARSGNWILAEYRNQDAPETFVVEGTPATP